MANHQESKFPISQEDYNEQEKKTGKRKIKIKHITNKISKQVTFSKRRSGLLKNASELSSLCGAVAAITFSSAGENFEWPELLGKPGTLAKSIIEHENPQLTAVIVTKDSINFNPDFCSNRVIIFVTHDGSVDIPHPRVG